MTPSSPAPAPAATGVRASAPGTRISSYLLTEYLERLGVEVIFGLCGHTVIGFLDALSKSTIRFVSTRHEQVAAHAADGYARASGKPGVVLSHLGPGLTNAATGVANAALDSIPMVVIAGDVPSYYYGRHPHQEVNLHQDADQSQIYRPFCKYICPLGALYSVFNPVSLYKYRVDKDKCIKCGKCAKACQMIVDPVENSNSLECIRCGRCRNAARRSEAGSPGRCAAAASRRRSRVRSADSFGDQPAAHLGGSTRWIACA